MIIVDGADRTGLTLNSSLSIVTSMTTCLNCGAECKNKFCSQSCSTSYNNKARKTGFMHTHQSMKGANNTMFGKTLLDVWTAKYGLQQALERKALHIAKVRANHTHKSLITIWTEKFGAEEAARLESARHEKHGKTFSALYPHRLRSWKKANTSGSRNGMYGKIAYPKLVFVEELGHGVRSSWEQEVCKFFKQKEISYQYEQSNFKLSNCKTYTPDIKLSDKIFVEIKGPFYDWQFKKVDLFLSEYKDITLVFVHGAGRAHSRITELCLHKNFIAVEYKNFKGDLLNVLDKIGVGHV